MKTALKFFFLLIFLFSLSITAQDTVELKKQIQEMNNNLIKAMAAEDWDSIISRYTDDAISLPSYEPMLRGKDAIMRSSMESHEAGFRINEMTLNTMEVYTSGNFACEVGTYSINMTIPGMPETWDDNGKYLTVWEKQADGSWKIKVETWNSDNNPWMDMSMPEGEYDEQEDEE
jgi:ketosteroid isomerase-like protein